jgi:hypothetical protein
METSELPLRYDPAISEAYFRTRPVQVASRCARCVAHQMPQDAGQMEMEDGCLQAGYTTTDNVAERGGTPPAPWR